MTQDGQRRSYVSPTVTDFGKVSVVTGALGMTFRNDSTFAGSMEFTGMGSMGSMGMGMGVS